MAELKILGVKRVEALLSVLDAKEKDAITALKIPSYDDIEEMVDAEFGVTEKREQYKVALELARTLLTEINELTGGGQYISIQSSYRYERPGSPAYKKRKEELIADLRDKPLAELAQSYKDKRTQLWMCETLEQAKAIVGIS